MNEQMLNDVVNVTFSVLFFTDQHLCRSNLRGWWYLRLQPWINQVL